MVAKGPAEVVVGSGLSHALHMPCVRGFKICTTGSHSARQTQSIANQLEMNTLAEQCEIVLETLSFRQPVA